MIAPSRRTLLVLTGAVLGALLLGGVAWFGYAREQSRVMAAYAEVMVRIAAAQGSEATPEARAGAMRDLEAILARYPSAGAAPQAAYRSEEHTSELQSHSDIVCRRLLEKKNKK